MPTLTGIHLRPYRLPLRSPWVSSRGRWQWRSGWLVRVDTDSGAPGWGDCAPLPGAPAAAGGTDALAWLEEHAPRLVGLGAETALTGIPPGCAPARCALETALLDIVARGAGRPLRLWLDPGAEGTVRANAVIGALDANLPDRAAQALKSGFTVLKLKVGVDDPATESRRLRRLADQLPPGVRLRLDANQAWTMTAAGGFIRRTAGLPVESLEEPLARPAPAQLARLQEQAPFPLALDESVAGCPPEHLGAVCPVRRLVLKPVVQGGLLPCLELARTARRLGISVVVTTSVESAVGVLATMQLAAAVDALHAQGVHGIATSDWLLEDVFPGTPVHQGVIRLPAAPGLGVASTLLAGSPGWRRIGGRG